MEKGIGLKDVGDGMGKKGNTAKHLYSRAMEKESGIKDVGTRVGRKGNKVKISLFRQGDKATSFM